MFGGAVGKNWRVVLVLVRLAIGLGERIVAVFVLTRSDA